MSGAALCLAFCLSAFPAAPADGSPAPARAERSAGGPKIQWKAPTQWLLDGMFRVHIELTAPEGGTVVAGWLLTPAAFTIDGKLLADREEKGSMSLPEGAKITADLDLGPYLRSEKDFQIVYAAGIGDDKPVAVKLLTPAVAGLDFIDDKSVPLADLKKYNVLLQTSRGDMVLELWPDVAPGHVRNFLDLSYTNFYSGSQFHRVIKSFMIQGGEPAGNPSGSGPRTLNAEFSNTKKHERGVLSMARTDNPNSASSQFFIVHANYPSLDGKYSAFGKLVSGYETLDAIASTPTQMDRPLEPQKILKATVILANPPQ